MHNWLQGDDMLTLIWSCLIFYSGMAKWQWYEIFIKRKVLRPSTVTMERELPILHNFLETVSKISLNSLC